MSIHLGIDIGGTFTDIVARNGNETWSTKVSTTPADLIEGVERGVEEVLSKDNDDPEAVSRFVHGTTVGTNAAIEQEGATLGLLMTEGFRDTLEIGRQNREEMYDLFVDQQTPVFLAPRERRVGIKERLDENGNILKSLEEDQVLNEVDRLVEAYEIDAVAICFLFSFANDEHERRAQELIEEHYPELYVSQSSAVDPKFREYERLVVTAFDAYLKPVLTDYISEMEAMLEDLEIETELQIMQSRGGITSARQITRRPVSTLLSGPAAAVSGAADIGSQAGYQNLITIDMGGTSCDVSLVRDGTAHISSEGEILKYPLRTPLIDVNTIGSGGGSIAWLDETNSLHVGPKSAGADPGPACYGKGGEEPTVTDASVMLGYINPEYFADGEFDLDVQASEAAIEASVADPLGYDLIEASKGIHNIVNTQMAEELRLVTVQRGFDPRNFSLFAMGGAGPVHAAWLAEELSIPRVIVPPTPGVLSASGLLSANIEHDHERTVNMELDNVDVDELEADYRDLTEKGEVAMRREGVDMEDIEVVRLADMQYSSQSFEITVEIPFEPISEADIDNIVENFHDRHEVRYGHKNPDDPITIVNLRVVHTYAPEQLAIQFDGIGGDIEDAIKNHREVQFAGYEDTFDAPIFDRSLLPIGEVFDGPAVIEESNSTTVVLPGQRCRVDEDGNLVIETDV